MKQFTYEETLAASQKIDWQVDDLIGGDKAMDFSMPFMPETFARVEPLTFMTPREQMIVNQIRGHGYLYIFGLVEEFILPFVMDHARPQLDGDDYRVRALLQFASEEAKHIHLFKCFRNEFIDGFGTDCDVIGPASAIAEAVMGHHPLAIALLILQIEWMTQAHYVESVRDDRTLDPQFKSLLKHHWMEEAQHAKLDTLMVEALAETCTSSEIDTAFEQYMEMGAMFDGGFGQQVEFDLDCFQRATGRTLTDDERGEYVSVQHQAMRWTFLGTGMIHPNFLATVDLIKPGMREEFEKVAPAFC